MPAEWAAHERTLMAWPCRRGAVGGRHARAAKREYAAVARRDRRLRAGADGGSPGPRHGGAPPVRPRGGRGGAADRRLVAARQRADLRARSRRAPRGRGLPLQRLGRQVPALGPRRRDLARCCSSTSASPRFESRRRARGRLDHRRRRGHADHHRAVPAAPQPQPGARPGADRARAGASTWGSSGSSGSRTGWCEDHDTDGHVDNVAAFVRPGTRAAPDRRRPGEPELRAAPGEPRAPALRHGGARPLARGRRARRAAHHRGARRAAAACRT